ncbi:MAG: hypothetical protein IT160_20520 [Bryobacterales bacterium]|nr:hypothetical protein [Bryobacterales bacterium]
MSGYATFAALWLAGTILSAQQTIDRAVAIEWSSGTPAGRLVVDRGALKSLRVAAGQGEADHSGRFRALKAAPFRLEAVINGNLDPLNTDATLVSVETESIPFTFLLRDARRQYPIWLADAGVAVTEAADSRSAVEIGLAIRARGLQSKIESFTSGAEESFEHASKISRIQNVPTWLGLGRDVRIFQISERLDSIQPRYTGETVGPALQLQAGRGWGASDHITRRLEDGVLPILHGQIVDEDITYRITAFVSLESSPLTAQNVRGTQYLVADGCGAGHMFTPEQEAEYKRLKPSELNPLSEQTVLYLRITAINTGKVPRYAFLRSPVRGGREKPNGVPVVTKFEGKPLAQTEVAVELEPGEQRSLDAFIPHLPIPAERAERLRMAGFEQRHAECRSYWQTMLAGAASIRLPEQRIDEMVRAGLLHLELIAFGREPDGPIVPAIGAYTAIGSESSPIIQFIDSMGLHSTAERALQFFLEKQHPDGFMQNFGGYMLETGAVLWSMGEHYRYTRDEEWVRRVAPKVNLACAYLERWHQRNLREDLRGKGYGMLEGKTADPEDLFRSFMLNGYAYLGLERAGKMLAQVSPSDAKRWRALAAELKGNIRTALFESMARSPVVPVASGAWVRTVGPWAGYRGPLSLYTDGGNWFTHGSMVSRDSLLGPLYLVFQEVLDPNEPAAKAILEFHNDLMTENNAAFSQPYYSRHAVVHLRRGEVNAFLKAYYNTVSALADRETYSFWEHYFHVSWHKTHEEAWFLLQTRWMLYQERGDTLLLLGGIPRRYLDPGKKIELRRVASYFGPINLRVQADEGGDAVNAEIECNSDRKPKTVAVRVPDPLHRSPVHVAGGEYDAASETVIIRNFTGSARVAVQF